ncbi:MAG TPA: efflux transporter outer membrane subunit [Steroidobacteraceae bacterium]
MGPRYHRPDIATPAGWKVDATSTGPEAAVQSQQSATAAAKGSPSPPGAGQPKAAAPAQGSAAQATLSSSLLPQAPIAPANNVAPAWPSADWWHGFGSAQLDQLMSQAQHANDDIAAAIARVRQADAQVQIAGAPLLPALSLGANASRQRARSSLVANSPPVTYSQMGAQASASYEIDFWGKNRAKRHAAEFAAEASRYDRATVELTVMTSVATTYFQALELHDRLDVAEQNLASAQTILKDLTFEEYVGTAAALDVAQQATTVAALNAAIPPLRQQLRQTLDALAVLTGRLPQELPDPSGTLKDLAEPQVGPGMPSELLARRPDVAQSEAQLKSANANIAAARAAFFPSIDLAAEGGYVSSALSGLFDPINRLWTLSAGLTQPIFQGGALLGGYRLTKAQYEELLADYHKAVISAFSNVEDALNTAQQTAEQYRREQLAVDKARRAYEITETELHAGTVNVLTVLNTQGALFSAEDTLVQVRFSHLQALVQLFNALGGGWSHSGLPSQPAGSG